VFGYVALLTGRTEMERDVDFSHVGVLCSSGTLFAALLDPSLSSMGSKLSNRQSIGRSEAKDELEQGRERNDTSYPVSALSDSQYTA